jgi:hypothetical protein
MLPKIKSKYLARAIACSLGVSSKGNYQIGVTVSVVDNQEFDGAEITWIGHFTEKTEDRTIESLQHFGWKGDNMEELQDLDAEGCVRLLPDAVEIVCDVETYDGETQLKVKWINKPGAGRFAFKDKLEGSTLKSFAAQMRGKLHSANNGARSTKPAHPNAPGNKDTIPF